MTRLTLRGGSEGDKRHFTRLSSDLKAELTIVPDPQDEDAIFAEKHLMSSVVSITNLSATGLHFVSLVKYEPHQHVWLSIDLGVKNALIRGKIVRRTSGRPDEKSALGYGVQFLKSDLAPTAIAIIIEYLQSTIQKDLKAAA